MMGFKGFGWILGLATVSPACYMVSSMVAAERARVEAVERAIVQARRDIRALDTEFDTRANFTQLERWNGEVLALSAPRPEQFVAGNVGLARLQLPSDEARYAGLVVPSAPATLVAAVAGASEPGAAGQETPTAVASAGTAMRTAVANGQAQAVAMIDKGLLSDTTIGDLVNGARRETVKLR